MKTDDILLELYQEVTPKGKELLNKLIDSIIFDLGCIRETIMREEDQVEGKDPELNGDSAEDFGSPEENNGVIIH